MQQWFKNLQPSTYKSMVRYTLIECEAGWENLEKSVPQSIVEKAYNDAWLTFGRQAPGMPLSFHNAAVIKGIGLVKAVIEANQSSKKQFDSR